MIKDGKYGKGIFTRKSLKMNTKILDFCGPILKRSDLPENIINPIDDRYIQIDKELFIGPSGKIDDLINHSCEPNCAVLIKDKMAELFSIKNIKAGEEITYDYSLQMYNETWTMKCMCGSKKCRGIIKECKYLPLLLKKYYLKLGYIPKYNK